MNVDEAYEIVRERVVRRIEDEGVMLPAVMNEIFFQEMMDCYEIRQCNIEAWGIIERRLNADFFGYGPIDELIKDQSVTEVMINDVDTIFYEKDCKIERYQGRFRSQEEVSDLVERIVARHNRQVNFRDPIVDTRLGDGSRVSVVLPPVATSGCPVVTIRKFKHVDMDLYSLVDKGTLTLSLAKELSDYVKDRRTILIAGGTGTGKTTFLNALSEEIDKNERIITVEDCQELRLPGRENLVSLECRNSTIEGVREISMRELIKTTLRMRPDRIIIGEVRGSEALDLLQAMNTGHEGSLSTLHANSCKDALARLEILTLMAMELPIQAIRAQIASAIDIIIHMKKLKGGRVVDEVCSVVGMEDGEIVLNRIYKRDNKDEEIKEK